MVLRKIPLVFIFMAILSYICGDANIVQLTTSNLDGVLANNELVFVNFYADWCRFSQMLTPVFQDASDKVKAAFTEEGKIVFGRIDCDREGELAQRFHVSKYPTLKLFRHGALVKREYRGQRSASALADYIRTQVDVPVTTLTSADAIYSIDIRKRAVIAYYDSFESPEYSVFLRVASLLRDDCSFFASKRSEAPTDEDEDREPVNRIVYRAPGDHLGEDIYPGPLSDLNQLTRWATQKCVPIVRELTFENAEELTEEGLPFLILFHHPDDSDTPERLEQIVKSELMSHKGSVNFLVANGMQFTHPLHHLGKTPKDLPVLAIDSFRHMYVWPHNPSADIDQPGLLRQFIDDLNSGKLHREFHQGPDPTPPPVAPPVERKEEKLVESEEKANDDDDSKAAGHIPNEPDSDEESTVRHHPTVDAAVRTAPPESLFRKLAPSRSRYTILRDEL